MRIMPVCVAKKSQILNLKKETKPTNEYALSTFKKQEMHQHEISFKKINKNVLCDAIAGGVMGTVFGIIGFSIAGPVGAALLGGYAAKTAYETNCAHLEEDDETEDNNNEKV